jgi:hypothetical protein
VSQVTYLGALATLEQYLRHKLGIVGVADKLYVSAVTSNIVAAPHERED